MYHKKREDLVHTIYWIQENRKRAANTGSFLKADSLYEWIKVGHFDFRYSAEGFVLAVVKECSFDQKPFMEEIEKAKVILHEQNRDIAESRSILHL